MHGETSFRRDVAEANHSGLAHSRNLVEFERLGSQIAKGILKSVPRECRRKLQVVESKSGENDASDAD